jgi:hypothetical protein
MAEEIPERCSRTEAAIKREETLEASKAKNVMGAVDYEEQEAIAGSSQAITHDRMGKKVRELRERIEEKESKKAIDVATPDQLLLLLHKQQFICSLSGLPLTPETARCDHIVPRSAGGADSIDNLQWLHVDVNNMKGQLGMQRFISLCELVAQMKTHGT